MNFIGFDEKREFIKDNLSEHWLGNRFIGLRLNYILYFVFPHKGLQTVESTMKQNNVLKSDSVKQKYMYFLY
jgi:hypothetical protein